MRIDDVRRSDRVTSDRITNEAARWGMSRGLAAEIVDDLLDRVPDAARAAREEMGGDPLDIAGVIGSQLQRLRGP